AHAGGPMSPGAKGLPPLHRESTAAPGLVLRARRSPPGRLATEATRRVVRSFGIATADRRPGPDLLVVGSKRGGTTSLWRYLAEHPSVLPLFPRAENLKGTYFFDEEWQRGERWYRSHFASEAARERAARRLGHRPATFEASPYYLFHPLAPQRAQQVAPDALIVAVLRDPVERAYSHWKERRRHTEDLDFEAALAAEDERTRGEEARLVADPRAHSFAHRHQTYLAQGRYAPMLERWIAAYGRERVVAVPAEEFYAAPQILLDDLAARLGLPTHRIVDAEPFNAAPSAGMPTAVRAALRERLAPDIEAVERLLGRAMPWPRGADVR
ncbi:MAG: putative Sulfotransferase, partial [Acidimicrobiales bacterium]|nr:putative Sulfotransferase [Acidimicrobiales bacterium]